MVDRETALELEKRGRRSLLISLGILFLEEFVDISGNARIGGISFEKVVESHIVLFLYVYLFHLVLSSWAFYMQAAQELRFEHLRNALSEIEEVSATGSPQTAGQALKGLTAAFQKSERFLTISRQGSVLILFWVPMALSLVTLIVYSSSAWGAIWSMYHRIDP